jgi:hypothetical protein
MDPLRFNPMIQHSASHMAHRSIIENAEHTQEPSRRTADTQPRSDPPARWNVGGWLLLQRTVLHLQRRLNGG